MSGYQQRFGFACGRAFHFEKKKIGGREICRCCLNESSNYDTWKVQCRMILMKDGLWEFESRPEILPLQTVADKYSMFVNRRNKALVTIESYVQSGRVIE